MAKCVWIFFNRCIPNKNFRIEINEIEQRRPDDSDRNNRKSLCILYAYMRAQRYRYVLNNENWTTSLERIMSSLLWHRQTLSSIHQRR